MELITGICAGVLVAAVVLILQKTMNMLESQQSHEEASEEHTISGWLLVAAMIACAVLVL
jgi:hypothetical protein